MDKELLLKSDILDIIFEKRNKAYGAYPLRKFYNDRLLKALGLMFAGIIVLSAFSFLPKNNKVNKEIFVVGPTVIIPGPKEKKKDPVKPQATEKPQAPARTETFTKPLIVDNTIKPSVLPTNLDSAVIGSTTTPTGTGPATVKTPGTGDTVAIVTPVKPVVDKITPTHNPEVMPSYPGGFDALRKFLERNLRNPKDMEEGEIVSVRVKFVVGYDGKLQGFVTAKDADEEFYKEVIRVLKKMPDWVPGRSSGETVSAYYTIPVKFVPAE